MSDIFFSELGIKKPAYNLDIHGGNHGEMTGRMLIEIEKVLLAEKPDIVIVYGDTNSTLAGALAAAKLHVPIAHVEAGLRSFNMNMPEEINRKLTDCISSMLFCPTESAVQNLINEGFSFPSDSRPCKSKPQVLNVGDVMYDAALYYGSQINDKKGILDSLKVRLGIKPGKYCLATIHRAENTDNQKRLSNIFEAMIEFSNEVPVILPLHPRTRKILESSSSLSYDKERHSLIIIDPVGYLDMIQLEKHAALIATDSGGVQKEAFFFRVPCVTLRDETEWVELVTSGWNRLAPPENMKLVLLALQEGIESKGQEVKPYGEGNAAKKIVEYLATC
jgi:UDP-GlcNAc3NAcA epimerase